QDEEDEEDKLYRDVNINLGRAVQMVDVHTTQEFEYSHVTLTPVNPDGQQQNVGIESIFETTSQMDVQAPTLVALLRVSAPTLTPSTIATVTTVQQAPTPSTTALSTLLQDLPNFGSLFGFDHRLKTLEANFSEFMQTNRFAGVVSSILGIIQRYMDQRMNEAVRTVNEQLEAEVLTRSSNSSKTSYAVAVDLSEMELKKILIEKIEDNKSIHRSNEQRNLYKALVEAYESDKIILDTYGDTVTLKRRRDDDADKDEEPSAGSDWGSAGMSTQGSKSRQTSISESATAKEPMQTTHGMKEPSHPEFETCADNQPIAEPSQHPKWFSQQKKPPTLDHCRVAHLQAIGLDHVRRDDDKLYKFKEGDFKRLRIQYIEDMLLLLNAYKKHRNPKACGRPSTRCRKLPEEATYRSDLKRKEAYIAYSNPRGFIYQNKDKQNRFMRIDELHKFSDGTLTDVRTALDDRLKGIRMKYLPQTIWRKSDKERAAAMIQAIDKQLKTRRIMRSLERFVGRRLYEGDFRMLQRTI
nr:hypothetical protein [Tanacetum cinerariifolium]